MAETDMHSENARQREHLERSVASLKKKVTKDAEIHRTDKMRILQVRERERERERERFEYVNNNKHTLQENVTLISENNDLRSELKKVRTRAHDLEAVLKIARKHGFDDKAAYARIKPLVPPTGLVRIEPDEDNSRIIEMQKSEIGRLRANIRGLERGVHRPPPGSKLPPIQQQPDSAGSPITVQ